jgi:RNA polymerase sigma-70 factor, ECF subfamily
MSQVGRRHHLWGMVGELAIERGIAADTLSDAAAGDALALARIVEAYHDDMARLCFVICGDRDTAQEAVQAAWSIAWRKLGSLRDPASLRAWLMTIAANEVRQQLRRQKRERVVEIEVIDIGSERLDPASRAGVLDLRTALAQLTPEDRALLAMRHVAGFASPEIGESLGISADAVRTRLSRLIARLRSELADD